MDYNACNGQIYAIRPGDTLYKISSRYNVPIALILRANPTLDIYNMQIGQRICIPRGGNYEPGERRTFLVEANMSLGDIIRKYRISLDDLLDANPASTIYLEAGQRLRLPYEDRYDDDDDYDRR